MKLTIRLMHILFLWLCCDIRRSSGDKYLLKYRESLTTGNLQILEDTNAILLTPDQGVEGLHQDSDLWSVCRNIHIFASHLSKNIRSLVVALKSEKLKFVFTTEHFLQIAACYYAATNTFKDFLNGEVVTNLTLEVENFNVELTNFAAYYRELENVTIELMTNSSSLLPSVFFTLLPPVAKRRLADALEEMDDSINVISYNAGKGTDLFMAIVVNRFKVEEMLNPVKAELNAAQRDTDDHNKDLFSTLMQVIPDPAEIFTQYSHFVKRVSETFQNDIGNEARFSAQKRILSFYINNYVGVLHQLRSFVMDKYYNHLDEVMAAIKQKHNESIAFWLSLASDIIVEAFRQSIPAPKAIKCGDLHGSKMVVSLTKFIRRFGLCYSRSTKDLTDTNNNITLVMRELKKVPDTFMNRWASSNRTSTEITQDLEEIIQIISKDIRFEQCILDVSAISERGVKSLYHVETDCFTRNLKEFKAELVGHVEGLSNCTGINYFYKI